MSVALTAEQLQKIEKIGRAVRDRGDVEILMLLDKIVEHETQSEQMAALANVVKQLNQKKTSSGAAQ